MAYRPKFRKSFGFYQRESERGDASKITLFRSIKNLPAKAKLYTVAYNLSSLGAFIPGGLGAAMVAPYFIGNVWNSISALQKGLKGDINAALSRGRFLGGAGALNKYGAKAFNAITPNTGIPPVDRFASIYVGQQKAHFLNHLRGMGGKDRLQIVQEVLSGNLDLEILNQAEGKRAPGKQYGIKSNVFRKWQMQTYYHAFKNAPDPWKNSPYQQVKAASRGNKRKGIGRAKYSNPTMAYAHPDALDSNRLESLMGHVDTYINDAVYYQGLTRYLASDALLISDFGIKGSHSPGSAYVRAEKQRMSSKNSGAYNLAMTIGYMSGQTFADSSFASTGKGTPAKNYFVFNPRDTVKSKEEIGPNVSKAGLLSTKNSRAAQQDMTDEFLREGKFLPDDLDGLSGKFDNNIMNFIGSQEMVKVANAIQVNPGVAKAFDAFANSLGISQLKSGDSMSELISSILTIFYTVQGSDNFDNSPLRYNEFKINLAVFASRLSGAGYSKMGENFLDLFGGVGGDGQFARKKGGFAFTGGVSEEVAGVHRSIVTARADLINYVTDQNSANHYRNFRDSIDDHRAYFNIQHTGGSASMKHFNEGGQKVNLSKLTKKERLTLVDTYLTELDEHFNWQHEATRFHGKAAGLPNPLSGKNDLNLWYGYDADSSMTTPYDSKLESLMGYKTRNRSLLQKELLELIERGAPPAVLVDYARRHYMRNSLEDLAKLGKGQAFSSSGATHWVDQFEDDYIHLSKKQKGKGDFKGPHTNDYYVGKGMSTSYKNNHNYLPTRLQIQNALHMTDMEKKGTNENDKTDFLFRFMVEFGNANRDSHNANAVRDALEIEFGGPATDRNKKLTKRTDGYVYMPSYFIQTAATVSAARLGIFDRGVTFFQKASESGIKGGTGLAKITIGKELKGDKGSVGAFNSLRRNFKVTQKEAFEGHRRVQALFKDMDKALRGAGKSNYQGGIGGKAMRIAHQRNLKLFREGGGFGDIMIKDTLTTAGRYDYITAGIFGDGDDTIFNINKVGFRKKTGTYVPLFTDGDGETIRSGVTFVHETHGIKTRFTNPRNRVILNKASGNLERGTIGYDYNAVNDEIFGSTRGRIVGSGFRGPSSFPPNTNIRTLGVKTDSMLDFYGDGGATRKWHQSHALTIAALTGKNSAALDKKLTLIYDDPFGELKDFFKLDGFHGNMMDDEFSFRSGHSAVSKFRDNFIGGKFMENMIKRMIMESEYRTKEIINLLGNTQEGKDVARRFNYFIKRRVATLVRQFRNQLANLMNYEGAAAFFTNEQAFRAMLVQMALRIEAVKAKFDLDMQILVHNLISNPRKAKLSDTAKYTSLVDKYLKNEAMHDNEVNRAALDDLDALEIAGDSVMLTHSADDGTAFIIDLASGEQLDIEAYIATRGQQFKKFNMVSKPQFGYRRAKDGESGILNDAGYEVVRDGFNSNGAWVLDVNRERVKSLYGVSDFESLDFSEIFGPLSKRDNIRGTNVQRGTEVAFSEFVESHTGGPFTPSQSLERIEIQKPIGPRDASGKRDDVFFSSDDIDYWYSANHNAIDEAATKNAGDLFKMHEVANLVHNVSNGGGSKAFMESALLEIFLEMQRRGISQQVAKEKIRGGVVVISKYFDKAKYNDFTGDEAIRIFDNKSKLKGRMLDVLDKLDSKGYRNMGSMASDFAYKLNLNLMYGSIKPEEAWKTLAVVAARIQDRQQRIDFFRFAYASMLKTNANYVGKADVQYIRSVQMMFGLSGYVGGDYNRMGQWTAEGEWSEFERHYSQHWRRTIGTNAFTFNFLATGVYFSVTNKGRRLDFRPQVQELMDIEYGTDIMKTYSQFLSGKRFAKFRKLPKFRKFK